MVSASICEYASKALISASAISDQICFASEHLKNADSKERELRKFSAIRDG